ncbi:hypothetical protein UC8_46290 [Roseimaritima ulvae]|uniref:Uncharacterized protein n=2 Tax=Roseimaritima ulvae TaxID=980254 RepID=A0A5B9QU50_9BACT|nr:hypothetical protein UC8_46290 [Roseimaritima ulvae]
MMPVFRHSLLGLLGIGWLMGAPATGQQTRTIQVERDEAALLLVVDGWAFWRTSQLIESTRNSRGQLLDHRIFRQRISETTATLVLQRTSGPGFNPCQAATPDGTLICLSPARDRVHWISPDGSVKKSQEIDSSERFVNSQRVVQEFAIEKAFQDGALIRWNRITYIPKKFKPKLEMWHTFAPFNDNRIDLAHQVTVRPETESMYPFQGSEPFRAGDKLVWCANAELQAVDLKTGARSQIPLNRHDETEFNLRHASVSGFDGELVLLGSNVVVDVASGKRVATNWDDERINGIVMTHARIGYRVWNGNLEAVDLEDADREPVFLAKCRQQPMARTTSGILVWTGEEWTTVPWYASDPNGKSGRAKP